MIESNMHYLPSLLDAKQYPMSKELSEKFILLCFSELQKVEDFTEEHIAELEMGKFGFSLFSRLKLYDVKISKNLAVLLRLLCEKEFPSVALYAFTIARYAKQNQLSLVSFIDFSDKMFCDGFPSQDEIQRQWLAQKGYKWSENVENLLDHPKLLIHSK